MVTGELRSQIDRIWDSFWAGGIANPLEVIEQITKHLWSPLEERVPLGAYQSFFVKLTRFFFDTKEFDLSPYFGTMPGESVIRARSVDIERIRAALAASPLTKEPLL